MVSKSAILVFCLIVALLPFPTTCSLNYGFPAVAVENPEFSQFSVGGIIANLLFAGALFYVILRLQRNGLFNPPWLWGVYAVVAMHAVVLLTLASFFLTGVVWEMGFAWDTLLEYLFTFLTFTLYLPANLLEEYVKEGDYDFLVRISYIVMMGVLFALGVGARLLWDRRPTAWR